MADRSPRLRHHAPFQVTDEMVANDDATVSFFPADDVEAFVDLWSLQNVDHDLNATELGRRVRDGEDPNLEFESTFEESGLLRTREVSKTYAIGGEVLAEAVGYLPETRYDPLKTATVWVPTTDPYPLVFEFTHSPPELASLLETGAVEGVADVDSRDLDRPCGCAIAPRIRT